jgi:putative PIN family toxin of toxin-antitoxin system
MIERAVLDTNIYVSAIEFGGKPRRVVDWIGQGNLQLLVSIPLRLELERILESKFGYDSARLEFTASVLWRDAEWIFPRRRISFCPDETDNRVLECAIEGKAGFIVTGDRHLLNLAPIPGLTILTADAILTHFGLNF